MKKTLLRVAGIAGFLSAAHARTDYTKEIEKWRVERTVTSDQSTGLRWKKARRAAEAELRVMD